MFAKNLLMTDADHRRLASLVARLRASGRSRFDHIAALTHRMRGARLVSPKDVPGDVITLNSRVVLRDLDTGELLRCTLADPHDVTMFGGRLSVAGPAGMALMGKRVGQVVIWRLGKRARRLKIERILYHPEAAGEYHL